jgi:calcium-dependent channel (putative phosphate transporter)
MKKCAPDFRSRQQRITYDDRYFLFLLVNVVFIFLLASTYWQLVRDLANSPAKIPEKLAQALQMGRARSGVLKTSEASRLMVSAQAFFSLLRDLARWVAYPCKSWRCEVEVC